MTALDELATIALLGSDRGAALPTLPAEITPLIDTSSPPAAQLLTATAILSRYARAGVLPVAGITKAPASAQDQLRRCSPRAADLLHQCLEMRDVRLIREWCGAAGRARVGVPHPLLPALLDLARDTTSLRETVRQVIDQRGLWLSQLNPDWSFARLSADVEHDPAVWSTGTAPQRLALLQPMRQSDPNAARQLVESTWRDDPADLRTKFVESLADRLSMDDEPFLETALDDRSKLVREAAAMLLARLSPSRLSMRMIARVEPLVAAGGKRRREIEFELPKEWIADWQRDGMTEKPPEKMGQRQWWLEQIVSRVPLSYWSKFGGTADELLAAITGDVKDRVLRGLARAAINNRDVDWSIALLRAAADQTVSELKHELISVAVANNRFEDLPGAVQPSSPSQWLELTGSLADDWPNGIAERFLADTFNWARSRLADENVYVLSRLLQIAAYALPTGVATQCVEPINQLCHEHATEATERFVSVVQTREQISRELTP